MKQTTIPVKPDARVVIKCSEDLSVEGIDAATMIVIVEQGDTLRMKEENGIFRVVADSDCRVLLPQSMTVTVEKVGGDATLSNLKGRMVIGKIGGDLNLHHFGGASVESVGGDCMIRSAEGEVEIARIGETLTADGIQALMAGSVGADIRLKNIGGKVEVVAGDDVSIHSVISVLPQIRARAGSDICLFVPQDATGQLELVSGDEDITIHAAGQDVELEKRDFSIPLGEGGAMISLTAGGSILVTDQEKPEWDTDKEKWDMEDHWKNFGIEIEQRVKESLKYAADSVEKAVRQAEYAGKHAGRQVERAIHHLNGKGFNPGRHRKAVGFSMGTESSPVAEPKAGPSDEERMMVLRMLQEKKITVEEAEKLLNALDR
ncbi:MAG: Uncharacterized protein FD147_1880 [Chloroflexi bacterium]|nr:MAG: Uncharacterized protein FD147_1880 [Chloroflexota bacterium]MBA4375702.1 hypothetical protein [Anaerolinea sp.]